MEINDQRDKQIDERKYMKIQYSKDSVISLHCQKCLIKMSFERLFYHNKSEECYYLNVPSRINSLTMCFINRLSEFFYYCDGFVNNCLDVVIFKHELHFLEKELPTRINYSIYQTLINYV